MTLVKTLTQL